MQKLTAVEKIEIVTLIDNYIDVLLPSSGRVKRAPHYQKGEIAPPLVAEHGLSLLIKVIVSGKSHSILLDAGWSKTGALYNLNQMGIEAKQIEAIVLSHGHMDHWGALPAILNLISSPIPVIAHPDVFLSRRFLILDNKEKVNFPVLKEEGLRANGAQIIKNCEPYSIGNGSLLITGEIERKVAFEKGIPNAYCEKAGKIEPDFILDDQAILLYLKNKGLVIITGCAHSGIINTVKYAQKLTGIDYIYAIIGGFHLSGPKFDPVIPLALAELKSIRPEIICPMHCTGFKAIMEIEKNMTPQFILSNVGSTLLLEAED